MKLTISCSTAAERQQVPSLAVPAINACSAEPEDTLKVIAP
jgi:hypothetical protein